MQGKKTKSIIQNIEQELRLEWKYNCGAVLKKMHEMQLKCHLINVLHKG